MHFTTDTYRIAPSSLATIVAGAWMARFWWAFALPLVVTAGIAIATADPRWAIVSLIIIFIIWPMALTMAWFSLLGNQSVIDNVKPTRATFDDNGMIFVTMDSEGTNVISRRELSREQVHRAELRKKLLVVYLDKDERKFAAVPRHLLPDPVLSLILQLYDYGNE